jgi:hypothetical protein
VFVAALIGLSSDICLKGDGLASGTIGEIEQRRLVVTPWPPDQLTAGEDMNMPPNKSSLVIVILNILVGILFL